MGNLFWFGGCLISWLSRKIKTVVTSTCAAEYIAASTTALDIQWIRELLGAILERTLPPTILTMDNTAAIEVARKSAKTKRSKYIAVCFHHIRSKVAAKEIDIRHGPSDHISTDALTKALRRDRFFRHLCAMGIRRWRAPNMPTAV